MEAEEDTSNERVATYKVGMLGASGVGKTALTAQFTTSDYICAYDTSLGECTSRSLVFHSCRNIDVFICKSRLRTFVREISFTAEESVKNGHFLHLRGEAMGKLKQMSAKIKRSGSGQTLSSCSSGTDPSTKWLWKFSRLIGGNLASRKSDANSVQPQVHQLSTDFEWACNARTKYFQLTTEPLEWNFISMGPVVDRSYLDPIFSRSMKLDADAICHSKCPFRTRRSCRSQCGNVLSTCLFLFILWLFRCLSHSVVTSNESVLR